MYFYIFNFLKLYYYVYNFYIALSFYHCQSLLSCVKNDDLTAYDMILSLLQTFKVLVDFFPEDFLVCLRVNYLLRSLIKSYIFVLSLKVRNFVTNTRVSYFKVLDWYEREAYDMFGIFYNNHPNLTRILTDYGFQGFPLRKEFPLTGFYEIFYNGENMYIETRKIFLKQDFNYFNNEISWFF